ncbi:hypothetical protein IKF63_02920 [Candidatus Saccharibacteria bacterium]|nr:hypothetical protein [Candidatus Saccharibacteria bacterium]
MKKTYVLAILFAILFALSIPLTTHATAEEDLYRDGEDDTRTVTIFNNAVEFCGFLKNKNPLLFQYMMQDCEEEVNEYGFAYREDIRVPDDEIWVLRNIRINFINPVPHFIVHGNGKLVIEGEHTRFRKTNGCAILIDFNMTSKNLFIKEGVFETEDGAMSPICMDNGELTVKEDDLPDKDAAWAKMKTFFPEDSIFEDISNEEPKQITELTPFSKWIYKIGPSWFYGFRTWRLKITINPNPKPEPELAPEPEPEPTPEPEPEPSNEPETPDIPKNTEPEVKPSQTDATTPKTPDTSVPHILETSTDGKMFTGNTTTRSRDVINVAPLTLSLTVFFTLFSISSIRGKKHAKHKQDY